MNIEALLGQVFAGDWDARDQLRAMGDAALPALPALTDALRSPAQSHRLDSLYVLEGLGPSARAAVPTLLEVLRSDDPDTAAAAADTLGAIGPDAVPGLCEALESAHWRVRQAACQALGAAGPLETPGINAVAALVNRAGDTNEREDVRARAVWALGQIGDASILEPLAAILAETTGMVACWIAEVIARFGRDAQPYADLLREDLHRDDIHLSLACASALIQIGAHEDAAIWALISCLQLGDTDSRIEAAMILGECGPRAKAALASLLAAGRDPDEELRAQAAMSIAKIRPEYATQA